MASGEPYDGRTLIVDTSAWIKLPKAPRPAQEMFGQALSRGQIRHSPIMLMEILFGMANREAVERERGQIQELLPVPITASICDAAVQAMVELAEAGSPGNHKVKGPDVLIAASAAERAFGVLHFDNHFDKLESVLAFDSVWLADRDEASW